MQWSKSQISDMKTDFAYFGFNTITLFASKLAACAGMNVYNPQSEIAEQLACRLKGMDHVSKEDEAEMAYTELPVEYIAKLDKVRNTSYPSASDGQAALQEMNEIMVEKPKRIKELQVLVKNVKGKEKARVERVLASASASEDDDEECVVSTAAKELKSLTHASTFEKAMEQVQVVPENVVNLVQKSVYTKHGTEKEEGIRKKMEVSMGHIDKNKNKFVTSNEPFIILQNSARDSKKSMEIYLGGRHDGMTQDNRVVEIKTRQRRFLGTPIYELVQVHAYMFIYNTEMATIIESFNGEERSHHIKFDHELWSEIKNKTATFFEKHYVLSNWSNISMLFLFGHPIVHVFANIHVALNSCPPTMIDICLL